MKQYICDKCKKVIPKNKRYWIVVTKATQEEDFPKCKITEQNGKAYVAFEFLGDTWFYDVCDNCADDIRYGR